MNNNVSAADKFRQELIEEKEEFIDSLTHKINLYKGVHKETATPLLVQLASHSWLTFMRAAVLLLALVLVLAGVAEMFFMDEILIWFDAKTKVHSEDLEIFQAKGSLIIILSFIPLLVANFLRKIRNRNRLINAMNGIIEDMLKDSQALLETEKRHYQTLVELGNDFKAKP